MLKSDDAENNSQLNSNENTAANQSIGREELENTLNNSSNQQQTPHNTRTITTPTPTTASTITLSSYHPTAIVAPNPAKKHNKSQFQMHTKINIIPEEKKSELNIQFLLTLPGVLKLTEVSLGFIAFILAICADRRSTTAAWTEHITFETTIVVSVFLLGYVIFPHLTLADEKTRRGLIVLELVFYAINTLFYFISIWLMVHLSASWLSDGRGAAIMSAILCVGLCVLYAFETLTKFRMWMGGENASNIKPTNGGNNNNNNSNEKQNIEHGNIYPQPTQSPQPSPQPNTQTLTILHPEREHSDV